MNCMLVLDMFCMDDGKLCMHDGMMNPKDPIDSCSRANMSTSVGTISTGVTFMSVSV